MIRKCLSLAIWLLFPAMFACGQNQILQAYVLQNRDVVALQNELNSKSKVMIQACRESLNLTPQQEQMLALACRGDVVRVMQEITEVDQHTKSYNMQDLNNNQEEWQKIWPIVMPVRNRIETGIHGKGSLFEKAIESALDTNQLEAFAEQKKQQRLRLFRAVTKLTLVSFEKECPLTERQRDKIVALINQAPTPKAVNDGMEYYVGVIMLAKLPKEEVQQILNKEQFKLFERMFGKADRFGGIEW